MKRKIKNEKNEKNLKYRNEMRENVFFTDT